MKDVQHRWPDVRRSIFKMEGPNSDSLTKSFIDHIGLGGFDYSYLSKEYKRAADLIVKAKQEGVDTSHPDGLFLPVGYLYRHALELKLKGLLELIVECDFVDNTDDVEDMFKRHNIVRLWEKIKPVLIDQWPKADRKPLNNVEALVQEFHKIDKSGQSFRYTETTKGIDVREKFPKIVRLELLQEAFDELYSLLDGCSIHFDDIVEYIRESRC